MPLDQFITYLAWFLYILLFVITAVRAARRPLRSNIDIALLFLVTTLIIAFSTLEGLGLITTTHLVRAFTTSLLISLPYMLLRLVDDFSDVPRWLMRGSEAMLVVIVAATFALTPPQPIWLSLLDLAFMLSLLVYTAAAFIRQSRFSSGVTMRRMNAVAIGTLWLFAEFVVSGLSLFFPAQAGIWQIFSEFAGLASGVSYYLGFATPAFLRRAWQEPELRAFLGRAASLPRLPDTAAITREMERGTSSSLGAPHASIGLWDEDAQVLRFDIDGDIVEMAPDMGLATGRAFLEQQPTFTPDLQRENPSSAGVTRKYGAKSLLAAPITAGDKRLGVLTVYAPYTPIFADEDLILVQLLADQAAVILESRALIDEAARVQALEEVTRLKDDFLSAAAHDLKTPLTTLVAQTQFLERRLVRNPDAPVDLASVQRLAKETQRLRTLVLELLDASRTEQGKLVSTIEEVNLAELARDICSRHSSDRNPCAVEAADSVRGEYDRVRILQLIENLVENAVKYTPGDGTIRIKVWNEGDWNHLTVTDPGIGIHSDDLKHLFDRFHRGRNVDDRHFAGMGLGLYICRGIAEQHHGRIWAESQPDKGSTFHVMLPVSQPAEATAQTPASIRLQTVENTDRVAQPATIRLEATGEGGTGGS